MDIVSSQFCQSGVYKNVYTAPNYGTYKNTTYTASNCNGGNPAPPTQCNIVNANTGGCSCPSGSTPSLSSSVTTVNSCAYGGSITSYQNNYSCN